MMNVHTPLMYAEEVLLCTKIKLISLALCQTFQYIVTVRSHSCFFITHWIIVISHHRELMNVKQNLAVCRYVLIFVLVCNFKWGICTEVLTKLFLQTLIDSHSQLNCSLANSDQPQQRVDECEIEFGYVPICVIFVLVCNFRWGDLY